MAYKGYRYSLASVSVVITFPKSVVTGTGEEEITANRPYRFGGQGSMIGTISLARNNDRFSADGDATGGFAINENLDATGTVTISIKQFAPLVSTLTSLFNKYDSDLDNSESTYVDPEKGTIGFNGDLLSSTTIEVYYAGTLIGSAKGCYLNMPELSLEEENSSRDFTFVSGAISFEAINNIEAKYLAEFVTKI